jgi:hypothetical protein
MNKFCKICGIKLNKFTQSFLCQPHSKMINLSGQIINGITAIKYISQNKHKYSIWLFKCHCGKEFQAIASKVKLGRIKSCGCGHINHCKLIGHKQKGSNNPRWIKDRTKLSLYIRKQKGDFNRNKYGSWQYFSKLYKLKHNLICELTGFQGLTTRDVETHHIISVILQPELCFIESNLIVIKKEIHRNFHKLYGKVTNDIQWNDYISKYYNNISKVA